MPLFTTLRAHPVSRFLSLALMCATLAGCSGKNPAALLGAGDRAFNATQWADAAANYEQYLELRPGDDDVQYRLGRAYMGMGQPAKAATNLRLVHTQVPDNADYTNALAEALFASGKQDELYRLLRSEALADQTTVKWMRLGRYATRLGDKDTAQQAYLAAARVDGAKNAAPFLAIYDYYRSVGQRDTAIKYLRMAAYVEPNHAGIRERAATDGKIILGPTFAMPPEDLPPEPMPGPEPKPRVGP